MKLFIILLSVVYTSLGGYVGFLIGQNNESLYVAIFILTGMAIGLAVFSLTLSSISDFKNLITGRS